MSQVSKKAVKAGASPAIALLDPKYRRNLGEAIRAASCFGLKQVWYTGNRIEIAPGERLPREERMKGYAEVDLIQYDYFFEQFPKDVVPVAVEIMPGAELLPQFEHPEKALYVFGSEDKGIPSHIKKLCHKFVTIPTRHPLNLYTSIAITLYDRQCKNHPVENIIDIWKEPKHLSIYGGRLTK